MRIDELLPRLDKVRRHQNYWIARCPAHEDRNPSLSITEGDDGRILLKCHTGCNLDSILAALDLRAADLFQDDPNRSEQETAVYPYENEQGDVLYEVVRFPGKRFAQRRPNGEWGLADTRRVLFHLPKIKAAISAKRPIYVVEGEKDVLAAEAKGATATCNPMGAGKWRPEYTEQLSGATCLVVADKDDVGRAHAKEVAAALHAHIFEPAEGKDLSDHLRAGRSLDELVRISTNGDQPNSTALPLDFRRLTSVEMRSIAWLDRPLWQRAAFQLVVGRKGAGKGTYLANLAARCSRGELYDEPRNVLFLASEDSDEIDLKPRIVAAEGNPDRIYSLNEAMLLPRDEPRLRAAVENVGGVGLVIFDPIASYVRGDTHAEDPVRAAIDPLNDFANGLDLLLLGVRHLSEKDATKGALAAVLGASAWVQVPRAVVAVAPDDEHELTFHIAVAAGNRSARGAGRIFQIELVEVEGLDEPVTRAIETGVSDKKVDDLLGGAVENKRPSPKRDSARNIILRELGEGPKSLDHLKSVCISEIAVSGETVWLAANKLKAEYLVGCSNSGPGTAWLWFLTSGSELTSAPHGETTKSDDLVTKSRLRSSVTPPREDHELRIVDDDIPF